MQRRERARRFCRPGNHERAREVDERDEAVELGRDAVAWVAQAWIAKSVVLHVGLGACGVARDIDTDEPDTGRGELLRGDCERRCFLLADRAP
jgi:hypothetical protein